MVEVNRVDSQLGLLHNAAGNLQQISENNEPSGPAAPRFPQPQVNVSPHVARYEGELGHEHREERVGNHEDGAEERGRGGGPGQERGGGGGGEREAAEEPAAAGHGAQERGLPARRGGQERHGRDGEGADAVPRGQGGEAELVPARVHRVVVEPNEVGEADKEGRQAGGRSAGAPVRRRHGPATRYQEQRPYEDKHADPERNLGSVA
ncbi:hypothetical protein Pelo_10413 [Pelomyxa schiedti]|nr:hypothetical protein Pelo_10413 [Pelomyxa schiedti]